MDGKHLFTFNDNIWRYNDSIFTFSNYDNRTGLTFLYYLSAKNTNKIIDIGKLGWVTQFNKLDNYIYAAGCMSNRYYFAKYSLDGKLINSFSTPIPNGRYDNLRSGFRHSLVNISGERFYYTEDYREHWNLPPTNFITYNVDYKLKRAKTYRTHGSQERIKGVITEFISGETIYG